MPSNDLNRERLKDKDSKNNVERQKDRRNEKHCEGAKNVLEKHHFFRCVHRISIKGDGVTNRLRDPLTGMSNTFNLFFPFSNSTAFLEYSLKIFTFTL